MVITARALPGHEWSCLRNEAISSSMPGRRLLLDGKVIGRPADSTLAENRVGAIQTSIGTRPMALTPTPSTTTLYSEHDFNLKRAAFSPWFKFDCF